MRRFLAAAVTTSVVITSITFSYLYAAAPPPQPIAAPAGSRAASHQAVLARYCVGCHNDSKPAASLSLAKADPSRVSESGALWEKVAHKLRTRAMPPAGRPRPDDGTYDAFASYLENELDRAAVANPNPGRRVALHRLSRTEYQHAIQDLLKLEDPPKEMDVALLLPADNTSSGFDNLADLLFVSPTAMDGYLSAAQKFSRLAVGDPTMPVLVGTYRFPPELRQDVHQEGLPVGTRGGAVIRSNLPLDGEYLLRVEFAAPANEPHQIEVTVDGERKHLSTIGEEKPKSTSKAETDNAGKEPDLQVRLTLPAGPKAVAVAFLQRTAARPEVALRPQLRGRGGLPAMTSVTFSGPYNAKGTGDTPSRRHIFVCRPATATEEAPCAKRILSTLTRRAYRRPVGDEDLQTLWPFYEAGRAEGGFEMGVQSALERLLVSPQFLFRIERTPAHLGPGSVYRITDLELASRLSFFLWSSLPDDELLELAAQGQLSDAATLDKQVRRMLADARSETLISNFAAQWLYLRDLEAKRPDDSLFPDFDESLRQAFRKETDLFLDSILRSDRSVLDLLTADYTFVNERLARHYGIPGVYGSHFRRVTLPDSTRAGLLGKGSILTLTSYATRTSPVLRGKWILDNILNSPPPPPPPDIPALEAKTADGKARSVREAMVQHRANPACSSCHARMDPLGFALENFDAVGRWRARSDTGDPIDVAAELPTGVKFSGANGLQQILVSESELFVGSLTEKLLKYAVARGVDYYDAPAIRAITRDAARSKYRFSSLVLGIVKSVPFQMRRVDTISTSHP